MADTKVTARPAATTVAGTDLVPVVVDPGGTPTSKKITLTNLFTSILGTLLPANVSLLGNRSAAAEFVQRGTITSITTAGSQYSMYGADAAVTFAVAFGSTPIVVGGGCTTNANCIPDIHNVSTTGFTYTRWGPSTGAASNVGWIALGA